MSEIRKTCHVLGLCFMGVMSCLFALFAILVVMAVYVFMLPARILNNRTR